jgi:hypothetical protein
VFAIVASRFDDDAQALVARWASRNAALLSCEDLSQPGWRLSLGESRDATAVVSGCIVPVHDIEAVLVRRPHVYEAELGHIADQDREYVAAEMNAFLLCWLDMLPCPVLNRPSPGCLSGPGWTEQQWNHAAALAGARVRSLRVASGATGAVATDPEETLAVTVAGSNCLGTARADMASIARRLAAAAEVALLAVHFEPDSDPPVFLRADPFPALSNTPIADAVLTMLPRTRHRAPV